MKTNRCLFKRELFLIGMNITSIINANRFEIQYNDPNVDYVSNEKAKWFFDNMTEYLDSLLGIQEEVAHRITVEVDEVLSEVVSKVKTMLWKIRGVL